ncbi:MAG: hypothetical protein O3B03_00760 [Proteobacteria bacterium]|nr:hypothetical protein [Pseudomonadota bacterium]MDA1332144.1 hypothetical protein [Pseudomonadota bacterium]
MAVITDRRCHAVEELGLTASVKDATDVPVMAMTFADLTICNDWIVSKSATI